jgi:hypothetical protein
MSQKSLPLQARAQWPGNYGYCGEASLITAGLYFGQYLSQYKARALASPGVSQASPDSQLLVYDGGADDNAVLAAGGMLLTHDSWPSGGEASTRDFLAWVKRQIVNGSPVVIGVLMNASQFPDDPCDQDDYDHIVPVYGVASDRPLSDTSYYDDDVLLFYDNGIYPPNGPPVYAFSSPFGSFQTDRAGADRPSAPPYSLAVCKGRVKNHGIAVTGIKADDPTSPVRVVTSPNAEYPEIADGTDTRPRPSPLTLTATVSELEPGVPYKLYRYSDLSAVPASRFNASAARAARAWDVLAGPDGTWSVAETLSSDAVAVYRAVRASAP